jgi:hypothetical protein
VLVLPKSSGCVGIVAKHDSRVVDRHEVRNMGNSARSRRCSPPGVAAQH